MHGNKEVELRTYIPRASHRQSTGESIFLACQRVGEGFLKAFFSISAPPKSEEMLRFLHQHLRDPFGAAALAPAKTSQRFFSSLRTPLYSHKMQIHAQRPSRASSDPLPALQGPDQTNTATTALVSGMPEDPPALGLQIPSTRKSKPDQKPTNSTPNLMKPNLQAQLSQNPLANRVPPTKLHYQDKSQEKTELLENFYQQV